MTQTFIRNVKSMSNDKYEQCLIKPKYSFEQSTCIKKLVQDGMKDKKVKKELAEKVVVLSKSPLMMEHPNEVGHLNFNELVMGFYPDNIRSGEELKIAIDHEIAHLIANDKAMPHFHRELKDKMLLPDLVEKKRPRHNHHFDEALNG